MNSTNDRILQTVPVQLSYAVYFTEGLFTPENQLFEDVLRSDGERGRRDVVFAIDDGVVEHHPELIPGLFRRASTRRDVWRMAGDPIVLPGGEQAKNDLSGVQRIHARIDAEGICRHSYVVAIGGGGVLDAVGYAAATAHRGVRLIRVPTTVLAQNDSGVGVKNSINAFGKKNFLGTFASPYAVLNDHTFLESLEDRDWRAGIAEAIKVALIKDPHFFEQLEANAPSLAAREMETMRHLIRRCAELHLDHIRTAGDPFEIGSSRPLDFGHWAAHKLEQMTSYTLRHGEAVAVGMALDCTYAHLKGLLSFECWDRILRVFDKLGFALALPETARGESDQECMENLFAGLEEFREHLGGELTLLLVTDIGRSVEVHSVDRQHYVQAAHLLRERARHEVDA